MEYNGIQMKPSHTQQQAYKVLAILQIVIAIFFWAIFYIFYTSFRGEFLIVARAMWILPLFLMLLTASALYTTVSIISERARQYSASLSKRTSDAWNIGWAAWNIIVGVPIAWVGKILVMGALGSVPNALIVLLALPFAIVIALLAASGLRFLIQRLGGQRDARLLPGTIAMGFSFLAAFGLFAIVAATWHPQWAEGVEHHVLFAPGDQPGRAYRIPAMIVLPGDTLLAFAESRVEAMSDLLDIDIVMRRSLDGGRTWSPIQIVRDDGKHTVHSPTPVYDSDAKIIWLPFCVDYKTLYIMNSADQGATWSEPRNLSIEIGLGEVWCHMGPGNGIQMISGRLVIPGTLNDATVIYSDNHGKTWTRGGTIAPAEEPQVFERADGALCANMRSGLNQFRIVSCSHDGGKTWEPWHYNTNLPDADTQGSIMRFTTQATDSRNRLLFSNPGMPYRGSLTIRMSYDEGETWPVSRLVYDGAAGYSQLAVLSDGTILVLFETGRFDLREAITLARVDLGWLTSDRTR